jgi:hypothetical protein
MEHAPFPRRPPAAAIRALYPDITAEDAAEILVPQEAASG